MFSSVIVHWDLALIVVFLATAVPWMGRRRMRQLMLIPEMGKAERLTLYASTTAFQWLIAAVIFWRTTADGIPPWRLGLQVSRPVLTGAMGIGLAMAILANQIYSLRRLATAPVDPHSMLTQLALKVFPQDAAERLAFFAVVVTVAFCEEWIYRGFVQRMFRDWSGSVAAGIVGSAILFAAAHLYQGRRGLVSTFAVGLLFSSVRFWTGSLIPSITAHFVADLTAGYWSPSLVRTAFRRQTINSQAGKYDV
jgi:membrane protease YdiL (CAAX protease family)